MSTLRKLLLSLMIVGAVGTTVGAGTFASLTASTNNNNSTFASGTIVLGQKKDAGSFCFSAGGNTTIGDNDTATPIVETSANNTTCAAMFALLLQKPNSSNVIPGQTVTMEIKNDGNLPGTLQLYGSVACTGGNLCTAIQMLVDETTSGSPGCRFGGTSCAWDTTKNWDTFDAFTSASPISIGTINAGASRIFTVQVRLCPPSCLNGITPTGNPNQFQGRTSTLGIGWRLVQT